MNRVGFVFNPIYLEHNTGEYHPERPSRLLAVQRQLKQQGIEPNLNMIEAYKADLDWLSCVHNSDYIDRFRLSCEDGSGQFDSPDCVISSKTYEAALWSSGAVLSGIDSIMSPRVESVFCLVRPPGHHAERNRAMGFCYFNNVAVGAVYLQRHYDIGKVFILDFDVHHGNGTQHIFENDPSIFYVSLHEDPRYCYPGTGYAGETGLDKGKGYTLNCPLLPGTGDDEYLKVFRQKVLPALYNFKPDFILLSAGFDAHRDDPLASLELTEVAYEEITRELVVFAKDCCGGRILSVLEGGYNLLALGNSVSAHISALMSS